MRLVIKVYDEYLTQSLSHYPNAEEDHLTSKKQSQAFKFGSRCAADLTAVKLTDARVVRLVKKRG